MDGASEELDSLYAIKPTPKRMFAYDWASGMVSPFRPTSQNTLDNLVSIFPFCCEVLCMFSIAENQDCVYDLGCGDGRVICEIAAKYRCHCVGVDLDATLLTQAQARSDALVEQTLILVF